MHISFIIPAYQCREALAETVACILRAGMPTEEILLIDDGSRDGTAELCDSLAEQYPAVRCIHKENGGVSSARNLGIAEARGDYIWFVDADDRISPIPEAVLSSCAADEPGMILFGMEFQYYRGSRLMKTETLQMPERLRLAREELGGEFGRLFRANYLSPVWNKLFRRSLLTEHQLRFDPALTNYEDLAFSLEVLSRCESITVLPEVCYLYQTDYDHDRTVDRIARIDNVAANTDLIADRFFSAAERCGFDPEATAELERILLQIYLDLFQVKLQTTGLGGIKKQCGDFRASPCFLRCEKQAPGLSASGQKLLARLNAGQALPIWLDSRYRCARTRAGRIIKPMLGRA